MFESDLDDAIEARSEWICLNYTDNWMKFLYLSWCDLSIFAFTESIMPCPRLKQITKREPSLVLWADNGG